MYNQLIIMENKVPTFEEFMFAVNQSWWILIDFEYGDDDTAEDILLILHNTAVGDIYIKRCSVMCV
jgi:hypothetical protein